MNDVKKVSAILPIPTEMILDRLRYESTVGQLFRKQTPEAEAGAEHERLRVQAKAETAAFIAALDAIEEPAVQAVLGLHSHTHKGWWPYCKGDDLAGYEAEEPSWPCSTVEAIADHYDIPVPQRIYVPEEPA